MTEDSILQKIRRWCEATQTSSTIVGIGDDAAFIQTTSKNIFFCSDLMIEKVHFDLGFSDPSDVGYKSLARSLSDIAAMGGRPLAVTIAIALPRVWSEERTELFLEAFYLGACELARKTETSIAGGDLSRIDGPIVIDVAAVGTRNADSNAVDANPWLRSNARPGDLVYVSGALGGAAFALREMQAGRKAHLAMELTRRHLRPTPRFDIVQYLQRAPITCAMDISDGLVQDANRLCEASGVSLRLDLSEVPVDSRITAEDRLQLALYGGDDYELVLVVPESWANSDEGDAALTQSRCRRIGQIVSFKPSYATRVLSETAGGFKACDLHGHDPFRDT